jgi:hypothetical protein
VDPMPGAVPREATHRLVSKETRELDRLRVLLRDADERMEQAAAAFVPHAGAYPPCTRCPRGAGPISF